MKHLNRKLLLLYHCNGIFMNIMFNKSNTHILYIYLDEADLIKKKTIEDGK